MEVLDGTFLSLAKRSEASADRLRYLAMRLDDGELSCEEHEELLALLILYAESNERIAKDWRRKEAFERFAG